MSEIRNPKSEMHCLRVGAAALNQTPLDWSGNLSRARQAIQMAREAEVSLLCLPELCLSGYGCEDAFLSLHTAECAWKSLGKLLPETQGMAVAAGLPVFHQGAIYNAVALLADGRILGLGAKQHLAGDGLHYEPRWFKPWPSGQIGTLPGGIPLGDLLFELGGVRLGFEICEDAWVAHPPGIRLAERGADLILNPSASHFAFGKQEVRRRFVLDNSRAFAAGYVYANLVGNEAGRAIYDGGSIIAAGGQLLAEGPRLGFKDVYLTTAVLDLELVRSLQARIVGRRVTPSVTPSVSASFSWGSARPQAPVPVPPEPSKELEFARAEALGLFDYLRKSRSRGFVVSLSGGADSGAVTCLVRLMQDLARAELGDAAFREKTGGWLDGAPDTWSAQLLTCVYQATKNSSEITREAARSIAEATGARFFAWQVDDLVGGYLQLVETSLARKLTWKRDDIALQNIQARVRAPGVWMLANVSGALLLSTSNRSEAAVGYATMDGDTSGGLSPIAGIDKAFLRRWLVWLETEGFPAAGIAPILALRAINDQQPTAELRPPASKQTDEEDLMPYPILDAIEKSAIRDKRSPAACLEILQAQFPGQDEAHLRLWTKRFFSLWSRNQWKRERYAPSFHLDDENLDPRSWCRFPILSGGFQDELSKI